MGPSAGADSGDASRTAPGHRSEGRAPQAAPSFAATRCS